MTRPLPTPAELIDYNYAVAGHDGTLCDVDGQLFVKPCTAAEVAFYEASITAHPEFAEYMPTFLGTLSLGHNAEARSFGQEGSGMLAKHTLCASPKSIEKKEIALRAKQALSEPEVQIRKDTKIVTDRAVVLENAAHGFVKPNILDVKLGVRLYADYAREEKKLRFDKLTQETTHKELGFRVGGMRIWQGKTAYGRQDIDGEGYKIYDKNYGRLTLTKDNVQEAFRAFMFTKSAGIDEALGRVISQAFLTEVERIQAVMEAEESRMFSASLLFVFEGDGKALRAAIEETSRSPTTLPDREDEDEDENIMSKIYTLKVIDFAHASWTPGRGPDENILFGVRSVAEILKHLSES